MRVLRLLSLLLLTVFACWLAFEANGRPLRGVDDAQILFSYSSNLVAGKGLVYANNPEHVEGATSLLWTLVCAVPFSLGLNEEGVLVISVLLLFLTQVLALRMIRREAAVRQVPSWPFAFAYLLAVFSSPAYITWMSITLMDTCLWGFLVVLMAYVALFPPRTTQGVVFASIPFLLAPLSRPEAAFVAPAIIVLVWFSRGDSRVGRQLVFSLTTAFLVSAIGVTVFRLGYFGYPLPNTYYAKVSPSLTYNLTEGALYLMGFVTLSGPVVAASAAFLVWCVGDLVGRLRSGVAHLSSGRVATWRVAALSAVVLLVPPVVTGGDHFEMYRFYQPALPLMVLAAVMFLIGRLPLGWLERPRPIASRKSGFATVVLLAGFLYLAYSNLHRPSWLEAGAGESQMLRDQFVVTDYGLRMGDELRTLFSGLSHYPGLAVIAAGGVARTYPGRIIDLMGLNTPLIAHRAGRREGFKNHAAFDREMFFKFPEIEVLDAAPATPTRKSFARFALKGLLQDPRFVAGWRYGLLRLSNDKGGGCEAFYRAKLVDSLERTGRYQFTYIMRWSGERWVDADSTGTGPVGGGMDTAAPVR